MSRLPLVRESTTDSIASGVFAEMRERHVQVPNLYLTLGNNPRMLRAWVDLTWPLRHEGVSPRALRELAIMRVAQSKRAPYPWAHHWPMAIANGITEDQLEGIADCEAAGLFDDSQRALLRYAEALAGDGQIQSELWTQMSGRFTPAELVELTLTTTFYINLALLANALQIPLELEYEQYAQRLPTH
jgi:alkylhydroperoxidase family enzyme